MRDEPHDHARRGRAPCKPRRGDHRGCGRRVEGATKGTARQTPPPQQRDGSRASCLRRESNGGKTTSPPPPPHMPPPPQGWGMQEGRGGQRPPLPRTKRHDGGVAGRGCGTDRAQETQAPSRPQRGGTGGANAEWAGRRRGPHGVTHTPAEGQVPCHVPVPCLRRAYAGGRAARAPPPPPRPRLPHPPRKEARATGRRRGGKRVDGSGRRTPPRGHRGRVGRQRDESAERSTRPCPRGARAEQAPTGGPPGVQPQEG